MLRAAVLGAAVGACAVLGLAGPAQAHDSVVASTPAEGETLTALPAEFSVTASQTIVAAEGTEANFGLRVTDAAGLFYQDGCVSIVDATMSTPAALGAAGAYTLTWQYVSSDGHPTSGTIPFTWSPPAGFEPSPGSSAPPVCGEEVAEAPEAGTETGTATPEPMMTTQGVDPDSTSTAAPGDDGDQAAVSSTALWLVGAVVAIILAVGATLLLVRPKNPEGAAKSEGAAKPGGAGADAVGGADGESEPRD
jgi:methionine-rich copper-binding protein CopC